MIPFHTSISAGWGRPPSSGGRPCARRRGGLVFPSARSIAEETGNAAGREMVAADAADRPPCPARPGSCRKAKPAGLYRAGPGRRGRQEARRPRPRHEASCLALPELPVQVFPSLCQGTAPVAESLAFSKLKDRVRSRRGCGRSPAIRSGPATPGRKWICRLCPARRSRTMPVGPPSSDDCRTAERARRGERLGGHPGSGYGM